MVVRHIIHLQTEKKFFQISFRRGARVVMEQIANLSTGNRCQGSNPCLSAINYAGKTANIKKTQSRYSAINKKRHTLGVSFANQSIG